MKQDLETRELTPQDQLAIFISEASKQSNFPIDSAGYAKHILELLKRLQKATPLGRRAQVFGWAEVKSLRELLVDRTKTQGGLVLWNPEGFPSKGGLPSPHTISLITTQFQEDPRAHHWIPIKEYQIATVPFGSSELTCIPPIPVPRTISVTARIFLGRTFTTRQDGF